MPPALPVREVVIYCPTRKVKVPCSAAESLRRGGANAEAGPVTAPQQGQGAHHANADKTGSTLDELMRSRSSSTGNLIGGDTLATMLGRGAAIAASSVKR